MVHVAMVEDDEREQAALVACLRQLEKEENIPLAITTFPSGEAFLSSYQPDYDIVFMDIEMPGINGMETARRLRKIDGQVILIFITHMAQFAISGYEVEALDFILKPVNYYSFAVKVKRAIARSNPRQEDFIQVKTSSETMFLRISSIRFIEVLGHYVIFHTTAGDYQEYATLKEVESRLNRPYFVHANRSFLVNLRYVDSVNKESVRLEEDEITISRPQKKAFFAAMTQYLGGKR
ncbi:MAG: response regulator transcription factor [Blautia sp.]|nr:response regulator transcription factor [Blautia sp.]